jgi:hypothetical protein
MSVGADLKDNGVSNDEILKMFRQAQKELVAIIEEMKRGSTFGQFRRKQLLAIDRIVARLEVQSKNWAQETLPDLADAGARETLHSIKKLKERQFAASFSGVPSEAVKSLVEQAWTDFGTTMVGLKRSARRTAIDKRRIQERIFQGVVQGTSSGKTEREIVTSLKRQGFDVLRAQNGFGRKFTLEAYSNMLVRSQNMAAYNLGAKSQLLGVSRRYALFPTIKPDIDGFDICNEWEKKKYVDLLTDEVPPASTHPNCRHILIPVSFQQLQAERPDLYAKAIAFYNANSD